MTIAWRWSWLGGGRWGRGGPRTSRRRGWTALLSPLLPLAALCLGACAQPAARDDGDGFWRDSGYWRPGEGSEEAMAALAKGQLARAEAAGTDAMRRNPKDPYALLVLATVYRTSGRLDLARQYYEALAALHCQDITLIGSGITAQRKTVDEIANDALAALPPAGDSVLPPAGGAVLGAAPPPLPPAPGGASPATALVPAGGIAAGEDIALTRRFQALHQLFRDNLITQNEYQQRRAANLGALLPYTVRQAPASGLGLPAPAPEEVERRMKALIQAFETREMTAEAQTANRQAILEALLPLGQPRRNTAPEPVTSETALSAVTGRLDRFQTAGIITPDEAARERAAATSQLQAQQARLAAQQAEQARAAAAAAAAAAGEGGGPAQLVPVGEPGAAGDAATSLAPLGEGVQLASYRSEKQAHTAWTALQKSHAKLLGGLKPVVRKVEIKHRGSFYRLTAGPLSDHQAAVGLCHALKQQHAECQPVVLR